MQVAVAVGYGAAGGSLVEAVVFYGRIAAWQAARHMSMERNESRLPPLRRYVDPPADLAAASTRLLLGAGAGWLFHMQITGIYAAIAVGASAPALLRQLGSSAVVRDAVEGKAIPKEPGRDNGISSWENAGGIVSAAGASPREIVASTGFEDGAA